MKGLTKYIIEKNTTAESAKVAAEAIYKEAIRLFKSDKHNVQDLVYVSDDIISEYYYAIPYVGNNNTALIALDSNGEILHIIVFDKRKSITTQTDSPVKCLYYLDIFDLYRLLGLNPEKKISAVESLKVVVDMLITTGGGNYDKLDEYVKRNTNYEDVDPDNQEIFDELLRSATDLNGVVTPEDVTTSWHEVFV